MLLPFATALPGQPPLRVETQSGMVQGKAEGAVRAFLGIPYAAPPVDDLRWRPPAPAAHWDGVRQATEFGPRPMQPPLYRDMVFRDPGPSEDCLSLNVWTPAKDRQARLPVMVWIFGGGFRTGGTSEQRQDGAHLAERGVVVVSMNYRLGLFGFLVHPDLIQESRQHAAGNYGLMDQLAALQWVHDNIAQFGGDPSNVTVFGESAGSESVSAQMASPLAKGLFQKAIGESGSLVWMDGMPGQMPLEASAARDADFLARTTGALSVGDLRSLPAKTLLDAVSKDGAIYRFYPTADGYFLRETVREIFAAGKQNDVPLLAGWTRDEQGLKVPAKFRARDWMRQTADEVFGRKADEFLGLYGSTTEAMAARSGAEFAADRFAVFGTWEWIEAHASTGRMPVFRYRFDHAPPANFFGDKHAGAYHGADILYVFGSFDAQPQVPWTLADRAVSTLVQSYWTNFARKGDPNGPGLPVWPAYAPRAAGRVMGLDSRPAARPDDFRDRYLFLAREWRTKQQ